MSKSATAYPSSDSQLLEKFVREKCEDSFARLLRKHEAMVIGCALRFTRGDRELGREIAQQVFTILARKAKRLLRHPNLTGWLYRAAFLEARRATEREHRRERRERDYASSTTIGVQAGQGEVVSEAVDLALLDLAAHERELIVSRYFEDRGYAEIAAELGIGEPTARKRMSRALSKLGEMLRRRGAAGSASSALVAAAATQSDLASAAVVPISLESIIIMNSCQIKFIAGVSLIALIPIGLQWGENRRLRSELETRLPEKEAAASVPELPILESSTRDIVELERRLGEEIAGRKLAEKQYAELQAELEPLRDEVVVSFGKLEEIGQRFGGVLKNSVDAKQLLGRPVNELSDEEQERRAAYLQQHIKLMGTIPEIAAMQEKPQEFARVMRVAVETAVGLEDGKGAAVEDFFLRRAQKKVSLKLTPSHHGYRNEEWDADRWAFNRQTVEELLDLLPDGTDESVHFLDALEIIDLRAP